MYVYVYRRCMSGRMQIRCLSMGDYHLSQSGYINLQIM